LGSLPIGTRHKGLLGLQLPTQGQILKHLLATQVFLAGVKPKIGLLHGRPVRFTVQAQAGRCGLDHIELARQFREVVPHHFASGFGGRCVGIQLLKRIALPGLHRLRLLFKLVQKTHVKPPVDKWAVR